MKKLMPKLDRARAEDAPRWRCEKCGRYRSEIAARYRCYSCDGKIRSAPSIAVERAEKAVVKAVKRFVNWTIFEALIAPNDVLDAARSRAARARRRVK